MLEMLSDFRAPTILTWLAVSILAGGGLSLVYYLWLRKQEQAVSDSEWVGDPAAAEPRSVPEAAAAPAPLEEELTASETFTPRPAPRHAPRASRGFGWLAIVTGVIVALALVSGTIGLLRAWPTSTGLGGTLRQIFGSSEIVALGTWAFYFGLMLLGMCGQYMWGLKKKSQFSWHEFLRPLWVSIIVFAPFWTTLSDSGISYAAAAGAYQNGFFWKIVLEKETKAVARTTRPKARKPAANRG